MAKKKLIVHIGDCEDYVSVSLCGVENPRYRNLKVHGNTPLDRIEEFIVREGERLCHKCKHIHKNNLKESE